MNLLVMGVDSNGRDAQRYLGTRSDAMLLVSLDPVQKKVGVVSIPRDTRVQIEGHGLDKINSAHALGGPELAVSTVKNTFLVQIDHYVAVDTKGLKTLFDALGTVEVLVEKPMHYHDRSAGLNICLEPGVRTLDPTEVEGYLRFRHDAMGDIGRVERQQWFLRQVTRKLKDPQVILRLPQLIAFARDNVVTDMRPEDLVKVMAFVKDIQQQQVETATLPGTPAMIGGGSYWLPDMDQCRVALQRLTGTGLLSSAPDSESGMPEAGLAAPAVAATTDQSVVKPIQVAIKYPRGSEDIARSMEDLLTAGGYLVKYKYQCALTDCQHEVISQNSARADDQQTASLRKCLPAVASWPVALALEPHTTTDFTLVVSPYTVVPGKIAAAPLPAPEAQQPARR